jgi:hypothetical protein
VQPLGVSAVAASNPPLEYSQPVYDAASGQYIYPTAIAAVSPPPPPQQPPSPPPPKPQDELKTYTVTDPKTGDLTYRFAGVQMVRKAVAARTTKAKPGGPDPHVKHHDSKKAFVSSELRVWQSFRDPASHSPVALAAKRVHQASTAIAVVPTSVDAMVAQYDETHGGASSSFTGHDLCTLAFCGTPEDIVKAVDDVREAAGPNASDAVYDQVNQTGHVSYRRRMLGVKKVKQAFVLGFGAAASPIEFATLAGRADNVLVLAKYGSSKEHIAKCVDIAEGNQFTVVAEILKNFKKASGVTKKEHERKSAGAAPAADP